MGTTIRFLMVVAVWLVLVLCVLLSVPAAADTSSESTTSPIVDAAAVHGPDTSGFLAYEEYEQQEENMLLFYNNKTSTLTDPRSDLFTSSTGLGVMTTTAVISTISSIVIIYIIARSSVCLGTVYHRIMVGVSTADILQSCAMALTTLPMPTDMIYEQFDGLVVGTEKSCNIQGTVYMCGFLAGTAYNIFLTFYYLCAITFNMRDATFRRCLEPTLHILTIAFALIVSVASANLKQIHPSPLYTFCVPTAYPYWCSTEDECLSGNIWKGKVTVLWFVSSMLGVVGIFFLIIIVCSVFITEKKLRDYVKKELGIDNEENRVARQLAWNDFTYTKSVMKQSFYYVLAYVAVYIFPLIQTTSDVTGEKLPSSISSPFFQVAYVLLRPSQGTMNLAIFLHHKVWKMKKQYPELSYSEALKSILRKGDRIEDKAISSVEIVRRDNDQDNLRLASLDLEEEEEDESGVEDVGSASYSAKGTAEDPSVGRVTNNSLGSSWMGLSLSAKDGSIQLSSQPSLPANDQFSWKDERSSVSLNEKNDF